MDLFITAFSLGLLSSMHCVGMCGPLALALPLDRSSKHKTYIGIFVYHFGKTLAYASLGILIGFFGKHLPLAASQQRLSIFAGAFIIIFALYPLLFKKSSFIQTRVFKLMQPIQQALAKRIKTKRTSTLFSIGILNGFLPCAMVYMALVGAVTTGRFIDSVLFMIIFALGTLPAMLGLQIFGASIGQQFRHKIQTFIPYIMVLIGVFFILRGMGLGIEFITPNNGSLTVINEIACN